jgi:hypothetical protein
MVNDGNVSQNENNIRISDAHNRYTFALAITLISAFLIFYGIMIIWDFVYATCPTCTKFEGVEKLTSTLGPIIAGIIGYYFGQKPAQELMKQNHEVSNERDKYKNEFIDLYRKFDDLGEGFQEIRKRIENVKSSEAA